MPKNVRIVEVQTSIDELTNIPIFTPVAIENLDKLDKESYIRIWESKESKDNNEGLVLEGYLKQKPWIDPIDGTAAFDIETIAERNKRLEAERIEELKATQKKQAEYDSIEFHGLLDIEHIKSVISDALNK